MELRDLKMQFALRLIHFLAYTLGVSALGVGLYVRWQQNEQNVWILGLAFLVASIVLVAVALRYYFSFTSLEEALSGVCLTFVLGFVSFTTTRSVPDAYDGNEQVMNYLLIGGAVMQLLRSLLQKGAAAIGRSVDCASTVTSKLLPAQTAWAVMGMALAVLVCMSSSSEPASTINPERFSTLTPKSEPASAISLLILLAALAATVSCVCLGSLLGFALLAAHVAAARWLIIPPLGMNFNVYTLTYFVVCIFLEPVVDLILSGSGAWDRWHPVISSSRHFLRLLLVLTAAVELSYIVVAGATVRRHKEWLVVLPMYSILAFLVWFPIHIALFIMCWQLINKIADCGAAFERCSRGTVSSAAGGTSMASQMAAGGVRHFALTCVRIALVAMVTSVLPLIVAWMTASPTAVSLLLLSLPYECAVLSLVLSLGEKLGGTCTGYGLIVPTVSTKQMGGPTFIPPHDMEVMVSRSTTILNLLHKFFAHHLIENAGCEYSTSGVTTDNLVSKLKEFFVKGTADGLRFDTYVLYYSGPVHPTGDWALAGNEAFKYEDMLRIWTETAGFDRCRLILVLDTAYSSAWVKSVKTTRVACIGLQTLICPADQELVGSVNVGDFTRDWVNFNSGADESVYSDGYVSSLSVTYAVSQRWPSFRFSTPTRDEISQYWDSSFPAVMKPLKVLIRFPSLSFLTCCCTAVGNCLVNCKMFFIAPAKLDTGHGFKLVRFAKTS